jgi:two-component system LytT family response regulator
MKEITAVIIDDERSNREFISVILGDFCPEVKVIGQADGVVSGLDLLRQTDPDILFLDIKMPDGDGFQLLEKLENPRFQLIFITAYDKYAIRSFKYSAVDYLLKPIDPEDMIRAVTRAKGRLGKGESGIELKVLMENLRVQDTSPRKIIVPDQNGFVVIRQDEVIRVEADGNYSTIKLSSGNEVVASKPIKYFEEMLEDSQFVRIHNSHLVNINHIVKYIKGRGGIAITSDGAEIEVSRRKKDDFLRALGN